jgi:[acyl-carrier-protein] S-malonyltransferase
MPDVLLFPGHAGHTREHLEDELATTETADIARRIDQVATTEFGLAACFDIRGDLVRLAHDGPEHADMAAFALSLARYRTVKRHPSRSVVLLGHSFGHLTALTCAGAFSVEDAARLLCYRNKAIATLPPRSTGMACLGLSAARTRRLLADADADAAEASAIACYNSPAQTVVAGPMTALSRLRGLALQNQLLYVRLPASFAFHTRLARPAVATLRALAAGIRQRRLGGAVFSATLRRFCTDDDDLVAQMARDLARPVYFLHAVRRLHVAGSGSFIECGPSALLTRLVAETLPGATVDARDRTASFTTS